MSFACEPKWNWFFPSCVQILWDIEIDLNQFELLPHDSLPNISQNILKYFVQLLQPGQNGDPPVEKSSADQALLAKHRESDTIEQVGTKLSMYWCAGVSN